MIVLVWKKSGCSYFYRYKEHKFSFKVETRNSLVEEYIRYAAVDKLS